MKKMMSEQDKKKKKLARLLKETALAIVLSAAISLLPILHLYVNNVGSIVFSSLLPDFFVYTGIGVVLYAVLRAIFRRRPYFSGIISGIALFFIVNFSWLKAPFRLMGLSSLGCTVGGLVLLALVLAGAGVLFYKLTKSKKVGRGILTILCVTFAGLLVVNAVSLIGKKPATKAAAAATAAPTTVPVVSAAATPEPVPGSEQQMEASPVADAVQATEEPFVVGTPNIYLFLFDEYGSFGAMEKHYGYDASSMQSFLESANVNVSSQSYAGWDETGKCMTDLVNLDYVCKTAAPTWSLRQNGQLFTSLKDMGYELYQYSQFSNIFTAATELRNDTSKAAYRTTKDGVESDEIVKEGSLLGALSDLVNSLKPEEQIEVESESLKKYGYYSSDEICQSSACKNHKLRVEIERMLKLLDFWEDGSNYVVTETPRAMFAYVQCPHVPFYFGSDGSILSWNMRMNWQDKQYYLGQYEFITKHMATILDTIITQDPNSIIIIQSDHGVRDHKQSFTSITPKDDRWVFNAVYFCGRELDIEGLSPINTLRLILSEMGCDLPPVEDMVTPDSADDLSDANS